MMTFQNRQNGAFSNYQIEQYSNKKISFGKNYYYYDSESRKDQDYMVKVIDKKQQKYDEETWVHLLSTIQFIKNNLQHPNLIKIFDIFNKNDKIYIVMERVKLLKAQLEENILKNQTQQKKQIDEFNYQMLMAIRFIHENKLVLSHLDTSSIGIVEDDCREMNTGISYKIIQFDYAYQLKPENNQELLFFPSSFNIAPEIKSRAQSTQKSDIYCLGLVMYEFIENGKFLFDVLNEIKHQKFQNAKILQMDKELHEILQAMISTDSKNRIASFDLVQRNYFLKLSQVVFLKLIKQSQKYLEFENFIVNQNK